MARPRLHHWTDAVLPACIDHDAIPSPVPRCATAHLTRRYRRLLGRTFSSFFSRPMPHASSRPLGLSPFSPGTSTLLLPCLHTKLLHTPHTSLVTDLHSSLVTGPLGTLTRRRLRTSRDTRPTFHDAYKPSGVSLIYPRFRLSSQLCQLHRSLGSRHRRSYLGPSPKVTESSHLNPIRITPL